MNWRNDVQAVRQVLYNPEICGFKEDEVDVLIDPDPQQMRIQIARLFTDRSKDDFLLLYFSGHGVVSDRGTFYFTSTATDTNLLSATAVPADFVLEQMQSSRSRSQVLVLDCCFSGAFARDMTVKGEAISINNQLGGQGRAVLTSSSATEYSLEHKESDLSVYTYYFVEGIQTGAADENSDGLITTDEIHAYTSRRVVEASPAMKPRIYVAEQGFKLVIAKAPVGDARLDYRKEVEQLAKQRQGNFSKTLLRALDRKRQQLELSSEEAEAIRSEVLKLFKDLEDKLQQYEQALLEAIEEYSTVSEAVKQDLKYFQRVLGLQDDDVAPTHRRVDLLMVGLAKYKEENFEEAIKFLSDAIQLNESFTLAFLCRGFARKALNDLKGATIDFTQAIKLQPDLVEAYMGRGDALLDLSELQGALADYTQVIELRIDAADAYYKRGIIWNLLRSVEEAIADFQKAADLYQKQGRVIDSQNAMKKVQVLL